MRGELKAAVGILLPIGVAAYFGYIGADILFRAAIPYGDLEDYGKALLLLGGAAGSLSAAAVWLTELILYIRRGCGFCRVPAWGYVLFAVGVAGMLIGMILMSWGR